MGRFDKFAHVNIFRPDSPETLRWIDMIGCVVYENTGADKGANIIRLI